MSRGRCQAGRCNGSVLILVLWTLFVLAALAVALGARVSSLVRAAGFGRARLEARAQAFSGVARTQARIMVNTNAWDGPVPECWTSDPESFGGAEAIDAGVPGARVYHVVYDGDGGAQTNVGVIGVEGRINLNHADEALLALCFRRIGELPANAALSMAKRVVAARSSGEDTKAGAGLDSPKAGGSAGVGALESVWQLLEIKGMDEQVWLRVAPHLTVHGSGAINLNAAPASVLACLFSAAGDGGQSDRAVDALVARLLELRAEGRLLEGKSVSEWLAVLRASGTLLPEASKLMNSAAKWSDVGSSCWEGTAEGWAPGEPPFTVRVDFVVDGESGSVVHWREW